MLYLTSAKVPDVILNKFNKLITCFSNNKYYFLQEFIDGDTDVKITNELIEDIGYNLALLHFRLKQINKNKYKSSFLKYKSNNLLKNEYISRKKQIKEDTSDKYIKELSLHKNIIKDIEKRNFLKNMDTQIIHGDFTIDNIIINNNKVVSIIDFELARVNSKLQDIGRIVLNLCFNKNKFDLEKINAFLNGYSKVIKIDIYDIVNSLKFVWINESNLWIQERYYRFDNTKKVEKFISEIEWISNNWFKMADILRGEIDEN